MTKYYKLTEEIKVFILHQKMTNPNLSCRSLVNLILEHFQVKLSKSLINTVIKENNLSKPVGRGRIKERIIFKQPVEAPITPIVRKEVEFMENGGCFFLKMADIRLSLTSQLATNLSAHFPDISPLRLQGVLEDLIYSPFFKDKKSLWPLIGKEIPSEALEQYAQQLTKIPLNELNNSLLTKKIFNHKINEINELHKECLLKLSLYVQLNFLPPVYKILDLFSMKERFYCLSAKVGRKPSLLQIQLFYPHSFAWKNDVVWQEDFAYAAQKVNKEEISTPEGEQIWISPIVKSEDEKTVTFR